MKGFLIGASIAVALTGCTNQQAYDSLQGARENECRQIADPNERNLCFDNAHQSYGKYEQQRKQPINQESRSN